MLAFPRPALWWLAWFCLVPMLGVVAVAPTPKDAAIRTLGAGMGFSIGVAHWSVTKVGPFLLVFAAALGVAWVPWGLAAHRLLRGSLGAWRVAPVCIVLASGWVVIEFLRSWEHFGGPGALLGTTQWNRASTLALASLGGVWLVSFVVVAVNVALVTALTRHATSGARVVGLAIAAALVIAGPALHAVRERPVSRYARVALVQPGQGADARDRLARGLEATRRLDGQPVDLVVWGESSVKFDLTTRRDVLASFERAAADVGAPLLVNVDARGRDGKIRKSAVLVTEDGVRGRYDKMRLVLFGEYVPLRGVLGWVARITGAADEDRRRGDRLEVLEAGNTRIGALISFEVFFPDMARNLAAEHAALVAVQSMTSSFPGHWAAAQAASMSAVRAVETNRSVVYSTMSGVSTAFDGRGRRLGWLSTTERGVLLVRAPITTGRTPYVRFGHWVPAAALLVLLAAVGEWARRARAGPLRSNVHSLP